MILGFNQDFSVVTLLTFGVGFIQNGMGVYPVHLTLEKVPRHHLWLKTTALVKQSISNFSYFCSITLLLPKMENGNLLVVIPLR